jgi:hypothetical protein
MRKMEESIGVELGMHSDQFYRLDKVARGAENTKEDEFNVSQSSRRRGAR